MRVLRWANTPTVGVGPSVSRDVARVPCTTLLKPRAFTLLERDGGFSFGTLVIICVVPEACGSLVESCGPLVRRRGPEVFAKRHAPERTAWTLRGMAKNASSEPV